MKSEITGDRCSDFRSMAASRRELLKVGVLGTLGFGLGDLLRLQASAAASGNVKKSPVKSVIVLQKYGAPSHID